MDNKVIETERLIIRHMQAGDEVAVHKIFGDQNTNVFLPFCPVTSVSDAMLFMNMKFIKYYAKGFYYRYAICLKTNNVPIGYVWLSDDASHDIGYGLVSEFWHNGIVTEAVQAVVGMLHSEGVEYVTATHDINNPRSGKVMKKIGMQYKYTYIEQWQPKNIEVKFRLYQLNLDGKTREYAGYKNKYFSYQETENMR